MKARNLIHARIEENIRAKIRRIQAAEPDGGCKDALQLLIEHSWERGERLDMQVRSNFKRCQGPGSASDFPDTLSGGLQSPVKAQATFKWESMLGLEQQFSTCGSRPLRGA